MSVDRDFGNTEPACKHCGTIERITPELVADADTFHSSARCVEPEEPIR